MLTLAEVSESATNWNVLIVGGGVLLATVGAFIGFVKVASGKDRERQIEPTALAALSQKIDDALASQPTLAREMGAISAQLAQLIDQAATQRDETRADTARIFHRLDSADAMVNQHTATLSAHAERLRAIEAARISHR